MTETAQTQTRRNRVPAAARATTRRDRVRAATVEEIKETARRILVAEGIEGLSLRAIAREMGMTAPALYRYFPSREELIVALIGDLYEELADAMEAAAAAEPAADTAGQLAAVSREFRRWAVGHPREFGLLFGSPIPGVAVEKGTGEQPNPTAESSRRFGRVFGELVARIYLEKPFPIPAEDELDPELRKELGHWAEELPMELPVGLAQVFLSCWIRLYGTVAMEVFGHLAFAVADAGPVFEEELKDLSDLLGMEYRPPVAPASRQSATPASRQSATPAGRQSATPASRQSATAEGR